MTDTNLRFNQIFEDLKAQVNKRAGVQKGRSFELEQALQRDRSIAKHERLLRYVMDVRNVLQHPSHRADAPAMRVSEPFLQGGA